MLFIFVLFDFVFFADKYLALLDITQYGWLMMATLLVPVTACDTTEEFALVGPPLTSCTPEAETMFCTVTPL